MIEHDGCVGCKYEHEDEASPHCDKCTQNSKDKYMPVSNADRIRSMNDEELANLLWGQNGSNRYWKSVQKYLDWLQQPSETEGKE